MGKLKHRFLFTVLTCSAYASPLLMVVSLWTNYWLLSTEKAFNSKSAEFETSSVSAYFPIQVSTKGALENLAIKPFNSTSRQQQYTPATTKSTTNNLLYPLKFNIEVNYGLWEICKKIGNFF